MISTQWTSVQSFATQLGSFCGFTRSLGRLEHSSVCIREHTYLGTNTSVDFYALEV